MISTRRKRVDPDEAHDLIIRIDENVKVLLKKNDANDAVLVTHANQIQALRDMKNYILGAAGLMGVINAILLIWVQYRLK